MYEFIQGERLTTKDGTRVVYSKAWYDGSHRVWSHDRAGQPTARFEQAEDLTPLCNEHAHVNRIARDCDGEYTSGYVVTPTTMERCSEWGDEEFRARGITDIISTRARKGTLEITDDLVQWYEETEEGYRNLTLVWCTQDHCPTEESYQRDLQAEKAGY